MALKKFEKLVQLSLGWDRRIRYSSMTLDVYCVVGRDESLQMPKYVNQLY